jgi:hypothetical protein
MKIKRAGSQSRTVSLAEGSGGEDLMNTLQKRNFVESTIELLAANVTVVRKRFSAR